MTTPTPTYRKVAGLLVPVALVPEIVEAIYARYPDATKGITDPDAAVRAALRAWVIETYSEYAASKAKAPLPLAVAQTVTTYEKKASDARAKALTNSTGIIEDPAAVPDPVAPITP